MPRQRQIKVVLKPKSSKPKQQKMKKKQQVTAIGHVIRALGSAGGGALGSMFGQTALGGAAGHQLGALASKWMGFGDYTVHQNSIVTNSSNSIPLMHKTSQSVFVRHKEFVGSVHASQDFEVQYALPLNPAIGSTFPWLSGIATHYQEYAFKGVVFHYIPTSGTAISGTNPALGSVMMQTTYRASDSQPADKSEMMNEYCTSECVPSETFIHPIECDPKENPFNIHYTRSVPPPAGEPLMSYDLGKTFIATQGQQGTGILGDVWVTYEVELKKPIISSDVNKANWAMATYKAPATFADLFDEGWATTPTGTFQITGVSSALTIPKGVGKNFLITLEFPLSNLSQFTNYTNVGINNTNGDFVFMNSTRNVHFANIVSGSAQQNITAYFVKVDPNQESVLDFGMPDDAGTYGNFHVTVAEVKDVLGF